MLIDVRESLKTARIGRRKRLKKLGTVKINYVEATPVVWQGRLLRFEWVRNKVWGGRGGIDREYGYYHFVDQATEAEVSAFAHDHAFGCAYEENGVMYVHGVRGEGGGNILDCFTSKDLVNWECTEAIVFPEDINVYNTSVCKGDGRYIMAIELGGKNPVVGYGFTCVFAESRDLIHWTLLDMMEHSYSRDRYTACPCIRYTEGFYYMIYLESAPCRRYIPYIVRTRDFKEFELGTTNPVMWPDDDDKKVICPERFTPEELDYIENSVDCNNSDFDICYFGGKTHIVYSWGNQLGKEFLALAEYDGTVEEFLKSFFE